ncbi:hypothetical protein DK37_30105 [Halomonas sp. SUBG004]|nr:hypothetical protein DK37_30105 [Halomonas sp. SUBG004]
MNLVLTTAEAGILCFPPQLSVARNAMLKASALQQEGCEGLMAYLLWPMLLLAFPPAVITRSRNAEYFTYDH